MGMTVRVAMLICLFPGLAPPLEPLGRFDLKRLPEASGIVKSRRHPGIYWTHNDSGNSPTLFAIHRDGSVVRAFRMAVPNVDWEDIADDDQGHLYIGDIGNNGGALPLRAVYRFDEPDPAKPAAEPLQANTACFYGFAKGDRFDAEGLYFDARTSAAIVVSKRFDGREAELFAVPYQPPAPLFRPAKPRPVGILPRFVEPATGASLSAEGKRLAVCSETVTRVYERGPCAGAAWTLRSEVRYPAVQIEGITWDGGDLIVVSEGKGIDRIRESTWKAQAARAAE